MKDFFIYFFGKGDAVEFTNFSFAHFAPILLMFAVILPPNRALRIAVMTAAVTALYGLSYLPWYLRDRPEKKLREKALKNR